MSTFKSICPLNTFNPRILIVSQQLIIAADIYLQLKKLNLNPIGISNGAKQALKNISSETPSVVLIDLSLKDSIDGSKLGQIVASNFQIPIIYLNPGMDRLTLKHALIAEPIAVIHAPYNINDINTQVLKSMHTSPNKVVA
jgi:AmiR/NasT family two-component response regulator